ncbi:MAG: SGNH/GDSL hydrolase family protein [Candidatus Aegiribacteria sp.]|nr:SGNH/GDSL hydrolase family protein [Candidatus Aegiribacteria sp.]
MADNDLSRGTVVFTAWVLIITGSVFSASAILINSLFQPGFYPLYSRLVFLTTGVLLISTGVSMLLGWKLIPLLGKVLIGIVIVSLIFESVSIIGLFIIEVRSDNNDNIKEANLRLNSGIYRPYVVWRASPIASEDVNVDSTGLRVVPGAEVSEDSYRVFVFGGSTMFGWRTSDSSTICGHLQRLLSDHLEKPVQVINFGQQGYVNTQEMIELQLQLKAGNIPDLVVFYDGSNEVWSTIESDTVGVHLNLQQISHLYESRHFQRDYLRKVGILAFLPDLNSIAFCRRILGIENGGSEITLFETEPSRCILEGEDYISSDLLAQSIMASFEGNLRIIDALSDEFDFDYFSFWQPVIVTGTKQLSHEETALAEQQGAFVVSVYKHCEEIAETMELQYDNFFCFTNAFDDCSRTIYIDICHLNCIGDSLVSQLIFDKIEETVIPPDFL